MRFAVRAQIPTEAGNKMVSDPAFLQNIENYIKDKKAEAAYFYASGGHRSMTFILNMESAAQMAAIAEPLFKMGANVEIHPVMLLEDLKTAIQNMPR